MNAPDFAPLDRVGAMIDGEGVVSIQVERDGLDRSIHLRADHAVSMAHRILAITGETGSPAALIGLSLAAMSGFGAGIVFTLIAF